LYPRGRVERVCRNADGDVHETAVGTTALLPTGDVSATADGDVSVTADEDVSATVGVKIRKFVKKSTSPLDYYIGRC